jgi:hypothetical protein
LGGRLTAEAFECGSGKLPSAQTGGGEVRNVVRALLRVTGMEMEERGRGWAGVVVGVWRRCCGGGERAEVGI